MDSDYMYNQSESQQPAPYSQPPVFYPPYQVLVSAPNTVSQPVYYGAVAGGDLAYPGQSADYLIGSEHGVTSAPPLEFSHGNQPMCYYGNSNVDSNPQVISTPFNAVQFFQEHARRQGSQGYQVQGQQQWSGSISEVDCNNVHGNTQSEGVYSAPPPPPVSSGNDVLPAPVVALSNPEGGNLPERENTGVRVTESARGRGQRNRGKRGRGKQGQGNVERGRRENRTEQRQDTQWGRQRPNGVNEHFDDNWTGQRESFVRNRPGPRGPTRGPGGPTRGPTRGPGGPTRGTVNGQYYHNSNIGDGGISRTNISDRGNRRGGYSQRQFVPQQGRYSGSKNDRRSGRGGWTIGGNRKDVHGNNTSKASDDEQVFKGRNVRHGAYDRGGGRGRHAPHVEGLDVESQRGSYIWHFINSYPFLLLHNRVFASFIMSILSLYQSCHTQ